MPLFIVQVLLIAAIAIPMEGSYVSNPRILPGSLAFGCGLGMFLWVLRHNRIGNFNPTPGVRKGARLVTDGPYRFIRHPMYLALMVTMSGFVILDAGMIKPGFLAALLALLLVKMRVEERCLLRTFPEYGAYRTRTRMLIPCIL